MTATPLHVHSEFSSIDGWSTASEIAGRCVTLGCPCCALTDHGVVAGHLKFAKELTKAGVKPIFGCEFYEGTKRGDFGGKRDQSHLIALAMNDVGLRNLWALNNCTAAEDHFYFVGRVFREDILAYKEGIAFTSACALGRVPRGIMQDDYEALNWYLDNLGDQFSIEISTYPGDAAFGDVDIDGTPITQRIINEALVSVAMERGVKLTYGDDGHYCNPAEAPIWMADLSFKPLGRIQIGDRLIGWGPSDKGRQLQASTVLGISRRQAPVVKVTMASGRTLRCTADHKWLTASWGGPAGSEYFAIPDIGRKLVHVIDPTPELPLHLRPYADYLAGIFDGEGDGGRGHVGMSQSEKNPLVSRRIEASLTALGFTWWEKHEPRPGHDMNRYYLKGGRQTFVNFANQVQPAQLHKIVEAVMTTRWRQPDTIIAIEQDGIEEVFGMTTSTGNYIAWGYASKNSSPDQWAHHDAYVAMSTGQSIYTPVEDRKMYHSPGALVIKGEEQVRENLWYLPDHVVEEIITNTAELGENATAQLPEIGRHLPVFIPSDCPFLDEEWSELSAEDLFLRLVADGIEKRYPEADDEVWERVSYECETLVNDGIHHYFLMGWDEVTFCDYEGITRGPGRGSSAGCIVAYALGITDVDPLHYGLIFERFWNSGRTDGFPDIDSDFSQAQRQKVIDYLRDRWGHDKVMPIGTVGRMKPKAVIDKLYKTMGMTQAEAVELKAIVGKVPDIEIHGVDQIGWSRELEPGKVSYVEDGEVGEEVIKWAGDEQRLIDFVDMCRAACSRVQLYGVHPSGIVISDIPLSDQLPAYLRGKAGERRAVTQFPMDDVDKRYFVKLDVLGLRTLDTLDHWKAMMADKGIEIQWSGLDKQEHPAEMWDLLENGSTAGIFQVEDGYAKHLCGMLAPRSVSDLAVIGALIRPGPQGDGTSDAYIARRNGTEKVTFTHSKLAEILGPTLAETYGLFVYQEQVIAYFNNLNYTLGESDVVRKILGKKKPEALGALHDGTDEWEGRGYMEMTWAAGIPEKAAQGVWDGLERFASYSFNKSHAVCYGVIGFRETFAKYYGPAEFYASCIRTAENEKRKEMLPHYVNEARRLGLEVFPPDIRYSEAMANVDPDGNVLFGFGDVRGVGNSGDYIVELRDKFDHSTPEIFNDQFEELNKEYLKAKKARTKALSKGEEAEEIDPRSPKQKLGSQKIMAIYEAGAWDGLIEPDISMAKRQELEEELLGVILTDSTKEAFEANMDEISEYAMGWPEAVRSCVDKYRELIEGTLMDEGDERTPFTYKLPGIVTGATEKRGKKSGKSFGIVTIEYEGRQIEVMVFNKLWHSHKFLFRIRTPGVFAIEQTPATDQYPEGYKFRSGWVLKP